MAGLDGKDRAGSGEVLAVLDRRGGTEVSRHADALEDLGDSLRARSRLVNAGAGTGDQKSGRTRKLLTSETGNLYEQAWTGVAPAAWRAEVKNETWVASSLAISLMAWRTDEPKPALVKSDSL